MDKPQLAMATDYAGESPVIEDIESVIRKIAETGFSHIHWCHEWDGDYIYSIHEMMQIREWMDQYGVSAKALHATKGSRRDVGVRLMHHRKDYTSNLEFNRRAGVELISNRIDLAYCLGASEIVLHLYSPHISFLRSPDCKESFYTCLFKSLDELKPYAQRKNVRICFENLFCMPQECVEEQFERIFDRYTPDFAGFCLDTGHANMTWGSKITGIIERYSDRLFAVHLHDNPGSADLHQLPGEGSVNWLEVMAAIAKSSYEPPLTLELICREEEKEFLKRAYETGVWLDEMYRRG